jgi:hypothetical protein
MGEKVMEMERRIPPHAMKGMANDTPLRRCCLRVWKKSFTGGACGRGGFIF